MRKINQCYLNKDKSIDIRVVSEGNWNHISIYNDTTDKSVVVECDNAQLKELGDFIYKCLEH
jgi:hypothetical protein